MGRSTKRQVNAQLPEPHRTALQQMSEATGESQATLIRWAVTAFLRAHGYDVPDHPLGSRTPSQ